MSNQLKSLYLSLRDYAAPLAERLESVESLEYLFFRYGWNISLDETIHERLQQPLGIATPLAQFLQVAETIQTKLDADADAQLGPSDVASLAEHARSLLNALADLGGTGVAGLPEPLNQQVFWNEIADHLLDDLLEEYIRIYQPVAYLILHLFGVIRFEPTLPTGPHRIRYTRTVVDWGQVVAIVKSPIGALARSYAWGDETREFEHERLLQALERVLRALKLPARLIPPRSASITADGAAVQPDAGIEALRVDLVYALSTVDSQFYEIGVELMPASRSGEATSSGLLVRPVLRGGVGQRLALARGFDFRWSGAADISDTVAFGVFPEGAAVTGGDAVLGTAVEIFRTPTAPWFLLGNSRTAHIEVSGLSIRLSAEGTRNSPETRLHLKTSDGKAQPGCKVVVPLDQADSFVQRTLGAQPIELQGDLEIIWSSKSGLTFNGTPSLAIELPLNVNIGAFRLQRAKVAIDEGPQTTSASSVLVRVGVGIYGTLGPVGVAIDEIGFACLLVPYTRQDIRSLPAGADPPLLGNLDLQLDFAAPHGVGLVIDTAGVTGGGYLFFDPEKHEYAGVLQLELAETIALTAIGLLTTRLPDGSQGYSLLISITAQGFQPIQLGLGFRLSGIGGLIGVNRTVAVDVLRAGLKKGSLDSVLFPADPVRNAAQIVTQIRTVFPPAEGRFIFGPMVVIDWGTPPVVTMDLAVLLEVPSPVRLIVLGQIRAALPRGGKAVIQLKMDVLGVLEIDQGELAIDAVLYDSRMLTFAVTGDMALRARWVTDPTFILAAGGLNPHFSPPAGFPTLQRLAISLATGDNPRLRLEAYLALTSNTAQIGARLDLRVAAAGFSIEGYLQFDALFQFAPFHFIVEIGAGVTLKWKGRTLVGVQLALTLEGPSPWHAAGKATFKIWIFSKSVSFDKTFGTAERPAALPPADPLPELVAALADRRSWSGGVPTGSRGLVSVRDTASPELRVHPLGQLTVRQRVVPLEIQITRFGHTAPARERRFRITAVHLGGQRTATQSVTDYFAPGQFLDLTEAQRLTRPSFELLPSGIALTADAVQFGGQDAAGLMATADLEYETGPPASPDRRATPVPTAPLSAEALRVAAAVGAAAHAAAHRPGSGKYRGQPRDLTPQPPTYVVAHATDLAPADEVAGTDAAGTSYTAAAHALATHLAAHPDQRGRFKIVAPHELSRAA